MSFVNDDIFGRILPHKHGSGGKEEPWLVNARQETAHWNKRNDGPAGLQNVTLTGYRGNGKEYRGL